MLVRTSALYCIELMYTDLSCGVGVVVVVLAGLVVCIVVVVVVVGLVTALQRLFLQRQTIPTSIISRSVVSAKSISVGIPHCSVVSLIRPHLEDNTFVILRASSTLKHV